MDDPLLHKNLAIDVAKISQLPLLSRSVANCMSIQDMHAPSYRLIDA